MLFLSLSLRVSNIARPDSCLWAGNEHEYWSTEPTGDSAFLSELQHIRSCKQENVGNCSLSINYRLAPSKLNSETLGSQIAILK